MLTTANRNACSNVFRPLKLALRSSAIDAVADCLPGFWTPPSTEIVRASPLPVADEDYDTAVSMTLGFYDYLRVTDCGVAFHAPHFGIGPGRFEVKPREEMSSDALGSFPLDFVVDLTPGKLVAAFEAIGSRCRTALIGAMAFAMDIKRHGPTAENHAGIGFFGQMLADLLHEHFASKH